MGLNHNTTFKWTCVGWSGKKNVIRGAHRTIKGHFINNLQKNRSLHCCGSAAFNICPIQ